VTQPLPPMDPGYRDFATPRQLEFMDAIEKHRSAAEAGRALGVSAGAVAHSMTGLRKRAASMGFAPGHFKDGVAPGFKMGKVTVQRGRLGDVERTWERQSPDAAERERFLREFVEELAQRAQGAYEPTPAPVTATNDVLAVYCFGDPHFGLRAIADEAGEDFDLNEADRITRAAIDRLTHVAPSSRQALLINAGDSTHADNSTNRTRKSGAVLDVDGRHFQSVMVSAKAWVYAAERLLTKHEQVTVWILPGNHDDDTSFAVSMAISMYFHREPRVTVDVSASRFRYLRFGKVMIGANHGDGPKPKDLPLIMATDRPEDWGASLFKFIYVGHIHHDTVIEVQGVRVETLRTLAAKDAWHAGAGYRSMRDTRVIVHHRDYGEIERHTVSAAMLGV